MGFLGWCFITTLLSVEELAHSELHPLLKQYHFLLPSSLSLPPPASRHNYGTAAGILALLPLHSLFLFLIHRYINKFSVVKIVSPDILNL